VGSVVLRKDGAGLSVTARGGFGALDLRTGQYDVLAAVAADDPTVLMNDGCCDPAGRLLEEIAMPVARTTSCCLGGPDLRDLFVTTARRSIREVPADVEALARRWRAQPRETAASGSFE
jgi:sugar lactone lactonase YvrE